LEKTGLDDNHFLNPSNGGFPVVSTTSAYFVGSFKVTNPLCYIAPYLSAATTMTFFACLIDGFGTNNPDVAATSRRKVTQLAKTEEKVDKLAKQLSDMQLLIAQQDKKRPWTQMLSQQVEDFKQSALDDACSSDDGDSSDDDISSAKVFADYLEWAKQNSNKKKVQVGVAQLNKV
jgi:hypothetical protein